MTLRLIREPSRDRATLGVLFVDGVFQCWTLEDEIRELAGEPVERWKVKGLTAIPAGRYAIKLTPSQRFQRVLPELLDVPGFSGVRIHAGNVSSDTEGCILVGRKRATASISESVPALANLFDRLRNASGSIWITVENPPLERAA